MTRISIEIYVVIGAVLAGITVTFHLLFFPFLFSEIDAIRMEFDDEIAQALLSFESSYKHLIGIRGPSNRIRRNSETAFHVGGTEYRSIRTAPTGPSIFSEELRKLAKEVPSPTDDYDEEEHTEDISEIQNNENAPRVPQSTSDFSDIQNEQNEQKQGPVLLPICPLKENRCPQGPPGPAGLRGETGETGIDGNDGDQGSDAIDELITSPPLFCVTCPSGLDGLPGKPGPTGKPGLVGVPGIPGMMGKNGQAGAPGGYGSPGRQGATGSRGITGRPGQDGVALLNTKGIKGPPGKRGVPGNQGEDGSNNNTPGPIGEPGHPGDIGHPGSSGLDGRRGEVGEIGQNGENSEPCTCESQMNKAIKNAERAVYLSVEDQTMMQQPVPQQDSESETPDVEIRRTPQNVSAVVPYAIPTLEELRNNYKTEAEEVTKQEKTRLQRFAVDSDDVTSTEGDESQSAQQFSQFAISQESESPSETIVIDKRTDDMDSLKSDKRPILFAPPRAKLPIVSQESILIDSQNTKNQRVPIYFQRGNGNSKKKLLWQLNANAQYISKKTRAESKVSRKRKRLVKLKRASSTARAFSTINENFPQKMDEGEKAFRVEKEIARESEKKIGNLKSMKKSQKDLSNESKNGNNDTNLQRVHVTPSPILTHQLRQNVNILENIAKHLGILEKPNPNNEQEMKRVLIP